ncbi:hypothetical protein BT93_A1877 [Corymbia citriodora subsp. variegata]|nr:hypothetical protein BT93_A1877 [Corymbia citriodora subsp. variegata]
MADGVITFLLNKLTKFIEEEEYLLRGLREDLKHVRDELESIGVTARATGLTIRAFLRVADGMKERDPELKVWVKQVRDVAFDIEDALDEYSISLTLGVRRQIAYRIFNIKARVLSISEQHQRHRYKSSVIEQQGSSLVSRDSAWIDPRGNALLLEESELVGIEKPRNQLVEWLVGGDPKVEVTSIVGMGGLGKTTLTKKVFDSAVVKNHFTSRAWITISRSFDVEDLLRDTIEQLLEEIKLSVPQGVSTMNVDRLKAFTYAFLQQRRYLIVLDDLWSSHAWEPIYCLQPLPLKDSWLLFCKKAFQGNSCPPHLEDISQWILANGVLATRGTSRVDEWEMIRHNLGNELEGNDRLLNLRKILSLGYSDLPYYLKSCLLYLSVFPEDHIIGHNRLVYLWITQGFVEEKEGKTLEEVAERYLQELRNRSLIQVARVTTDGRINAYRVHDILREILLKKSKDQNFAKISNPMTAKCSGDARRVAIHFSQANPQLSKINAIRLHSTHLRHLLLYRYELGSDLYYSKYGFKARAGIGSLVSLQKLSCIEADRKNRVIMDIGSMRQLTKLNVKNLKREDGKALCSSIQNLSRLQVLSLCSVDPAEVIDIGQLTPPRFLQRLYLEGRLESIPSWTSSLLQDDPLESLEGLPNLVELQLGDAYEGESLCFRRGGFPRLKLLWLIKLRNLKRVTMEEDTMPRLEKLTLRRCESLKEMPPDVKRLSSLKVIVFDGMPGELLARQNAEASHLLKVFVHDGLWTRYV